MLSSSVASQYSRSKYGAPGVRLLMLHPRLSPSVTDERRSRRYNNMFFSTKDQPLVVALVISATLVS